MLEWVLNYIIWPALIGCCVAVIFDIFIAKKKPWRG